MIVKPLRDLGIPTAAIVDIDVLKDGGDTWTDFLSSGFVPKAQNHSLGHLRGHLKEKLNASGKDMKRDGGITLLTGEDREAAKNLLRTLADYGLFVVENGELEYWLKHLGVGGHGPNWLVKIFEKMGEDPSQYSYVKPSAGDVWEFVQKVRTWLLNPNRSGIPD